MDRFLTRDLRRSVRFRFHGARHCAEKWEWRTSRKGYVVSTFYGLMINFALRPALDRLTRSTPLMRSFTPYLESAPIISYYQSLSLNKNISPTNNLAKFIYRFKFSVPVLDPIVNKLNRERIAKSLITDKPIEKKEPFIEWEINRNSLIQRNASSCSKARAPLFLPRRRRATRQRVWSTRVHRETVKLARFLLIRTWCLAVVREVLDEQSSPVHRVNFAAHPVMKFRQLANKLAVISRAAYLCKQNRV